MVLLAVCKVCLCTCTLCIDIESSRGNAREYDVRIQVKIPEKLEQQLKAAMQEAGIPVPEMEERWNQAMNALKVSPAPS